MPFTRDKDIKTYEEEYATIGNIVFAWQNNKLSSNDISQPLAVYHAAGEMYGYMYREDKNIECPIEDLIKDYNALVDLLDMLKKDYSDDKELGSCISELENCIDKIIFITSTQAIISQDHDIVSTLQSNPETIKSNLIVADCSFRALYEIFNTEILVPETDEEAGAEVSGSVASSDDTPA